MLNFPRALTLTLSTVQSLLTQLFCWEKMKGWDIWGDLGNDTLAPRFCSKFLHISRYELVPKKVKEDEFWRNYFYRVGLAKQSFELAPVAPITTTTTAKPANTNPTANRWKAMKSLNHKFQSSIKCWNAGTEISKFCTLLHSTGPWMMLRMEVATKRTSSSLNSKRC